MDGHREPTVEDREGGSDMDTEMPLKPVSQRPVDQRRGTFKLHLSLKLAREDGVDLDLAKPLLDHDFDPPDAGFAGTFAHDDAP